MTLLYIAFQPGTSSESRDGESCAFHDPPVLSPQVEVDLTQTAADHNQDKGAKGDIDIDSETFTVFPENSLYHKLSPGERITLVNKYILVPPLVEVESKKKKDKNEIVTDEKDKLIQSFPVHSVVENAFSMYVENFEKASFKTLSAEPTGKASENAPADPPFQFKATKSTPASNQYDIKSGFQVAPSIEKWDFKTHNRAIPQVVSFDGDISHIKEDSKTSNPSSIKLTDGEWGNLQKSASYALRAVSHASWFRDSAFSALDRALPLLDPSLPQNAHCIETLTDVKQFLIGMEYALDKLARYCVYPHAGVTSVLRKEFLYTENKSMLLEEQSKLFSLPYGKSLVFQGMIHSVAPQVKQYRDESRANQLLESNTKLADAVAKSKGGSGGGSAGANNFHNTRSSSRSQSRQGSGSSYNSRKSGFSASPPRQPNRYPSRGGERWWRQTASLPSK